MFERRQMECSFWYNAGRCHIMFFITVVEFDKDLFSKSGSEKPPYKGK